MITFIDQNIHHSTIHWCTNFTISGNIGSFWCSISSMKIQQQIKSDVDGIVDDVLGQQGQQVKKRQMLFVIKKSF
jgi:pyruvate carboxylase